MTMNRAQRRALKANMRRRGHVTVTLRGGPMDGWLVKDGAPALEADWRAKYLEEVAQSLHRQRISDEFHLPHPPWEKLDEGTRAAYRQQAATERGAGRYALRPDGLEADWVAEA